MSQEDDERVPLRGALRVCRGNGHLSILRSTKTAPCLSKDVGRWEMAGFPLKPTDIPLGNAGPTLPHRRRPADVGAWSLNFREVAGILFKPSVLLTLTVQIEAHGRAYRKTSHRGVDRSFL